MKSTLLIMGFIIGLLYLPWAWYMSYLLYKHVHATELMWFLFWMNIPFSLLFAIIGKLLEKIK